MKAIIFAALAIFSVNAAAAESVYVRTELYRNGELVSQPNVIAPNGSQRPYRNVEYRKFRELVGNKVHLGRLKLGTTAYFTPVITSDGDIRLTMDVNYVRLNEMKADKFGNLTVDFPQTDGFMYKGTDVIPNGGRREYKSNDNGEEYIYVVSAIKQ
ncbi:hypothetical protein [Pseudomonas asiatica]|uniref:hypothetical protein n=1 Tax=Pseudomonas asiatica TaxID=2219225 RepID=UPI0014854069|nr:hypothetical protein [Pseudomonas asiatica]